MYLVYAHSATGIALACSGSTLAIAGATRVGSTVRSRLHGLDKLRLYVLIARSIISKRLNLFLIRDMIDFAAMA